MCDQCDTGERLYGKGSVQYIAIRGLYHPPPKATHEHKYPAWDDIEEGYVCGKCPGYLVRCACGAVAKSSTAYGSTDTALIFTCGPNGQCIGLGDARAEPITERSMPAATMPPPEQPICQTYYGFPCTCAVQHEIKRRKW